MAATAGPSRRLAERQCAFPPAASTDSIARSAASERSTRQDLPVDRDRRRLLALRPRLLDEGELQLLAVLRG